MTMTYRRSLAVFLALALLSGWTQAQAQRNAQPDARTGDLVDDAPPALGEPARTALDRARDDIAAASALLTHASTLESGPGESGPGESGPGEPGPAERQGAVAAALGHVVDARGALAQAVTSAKAAGAAPDVATDAVNRAVAGLDELARTLRQLDPPILAASIDAALIHLQEAARRIDMAYPPLTGGARSE